MGILKITLLLLMPLVFIDFVNYAAARPISYPGGYTVMSFSDNMKDSIYFHYSPTYKYSIGIEGVEDKYFNKKYSYLRFTYLLNRKNTQTSQRNLYFHSGLSSDGLDNYFYAIHGDWETRRWFSGFGYKQTKTKIKDYSDQYLQLGVAPYKGAYGDLHTWIMIKSKKNSLTNNWSTYPILKFFKGNYLMEFGYNDKTEWDVHLIYRF